MALNTFFDTSAFYALLDESGEDFQPALRWMDSITEDRGEHLVTHDYVVVETCALLQRRMGVDAVRIFVDSLLPACEIRFIDQSLYERALGAYLASASRRRSLVDQVSFELMRRDAIERVFTFDGDFAKAGFTVVPD